MDRIATMNQGTVLDTRTGVALAGALLFWSSAFAAIRVSLDAYGAGELALLRFLTASFVLAIYAWMTKMPLPKLRDVPSIGLLGVVGICGYHLALNFGEKTVTAGAASLIIASTPAFTALIASRVLAERMNIRKWFGIAVSFAGILLITFGEGGSFRLESGALLVLAAALSTSAYNVLQKRVIDRYTPVQFATFTIWAGTIPLLLFAPGLVADIAGAPWVATGAVIYLGVCPGAIAYVLWVYAISRTDVSNVASFLYLNPVLAIAIAWIWLGEIPSWLSLGGGVVVVSGVVLTNTRFRRSRMDRLRRHR